MFITGGLLEYKYTDHQGCLDYFVFRYLINQKDCKRHVNNCGGNEARRCCTAWVSLTSNPTRLTFSSSVALPAEFSCCYAREERLRGWVQGQGGDEGGGGGGDGCGDGGDGGGGPSSVGRESVVTVLDTTYFLFSFLSFSNRNGIILSIGAYMCSINSCNKCYKNDFISSNIDLRKYIQLKSLIIIYNDNKYVNNIEDNDLLREDERMRKINMENCEVCNCARKNWEEKYLFPPLYSLFKNVFRIRGTPEKELTSKSKTRRLVGMAGRRIVSLDTITPSTNKENGTINRNVIVSPQKTIVNKKSRFPLEDCDPNNQDKDYGNTNLLERDNRTGFQFAEPLGVAPRRMSVDQRSPMQSPIRSSPHKLVTDPMIFRSLSSGYESMDDDLNDLMDLDALDEATHLPNGLTSLLSGSIVGSEIMEYAIITTPEYPRSKMKRSFRRSLSLQNDRTNPQSSISKVRSCLFRSPSTTCSTRKLSFDDNIQSRTPSSYSSIIDSSSNQSTRASCKRSEPPTSLSPRLIKRSRISVDFKHLPDNVELEISSNDEASSYVTDIETKLVKKSNLSIENDITKDEVDFCNVSIKESFDNKFEDSQAHAMIKSAIHRSITDADLTGDFSKPCILPLAEGRHDDLKSISVDTLAGLIRGDFKQYIDSFAIVDCRYPYEFDGGHIEGALNLYNKELIEQHLLDPLKNVPKIQPNSIKRRILVFHCEFSWERGPNLSRFLRNIDRQRNKEHYPALHYPEVYLLHGGYEQFYKEQRNLCIPQGYKPMSDPNHEADLKQFRVKSKSWQGEKPVSRLNGLVVRTNIKRLGF
ncbi:hypothetical protein M0802_009870 [Mischocyttarus mexicanus]|nr:hypothetical protein M0802_009870 [Mischocyttarus mexicanus]